MKNSTIILSVFFFFLSSIILLSQNEVKPKVYNIWAKTDLQKRTYKGYLYKVEDEQITITKKFNLDAVDNEFYQVPTQNIDYLQFRNRGKFERGVLLGGILGGVTGIALGLGIKEKNCDDPWLCWLIPSRRTKRAFLTITGTTLGAVIGGMASSAKVRIRINRSQEEYDINKKKLETYILKN